MKRLKSEFDSRFAKDPSLAIDYVGAQIFRTRRVSGPLMIALCDAIDRLRVDGNEADLCVALSERAVGLATWYQSAPPSSFPKNDGADVLAYAGAVHGSAVSSRGPTPAMTCVAEVYKLADQILSRSVRMCPSDAVLGTLYARRATVSLRQSRFLEALEHADIGVVKSLAHPRS